MIIVGVTAASALLVMSLTYVTGDETTNISAKSGTSTQLQVANITGDLTQASGGNSYGGQETGEIFINSDVLRLTLRD